MFYYLDGTVAELLPYLAVIDCGGVGYACKTTNNTLASLKKGQRGKLYTYLNVGEDVFDLYGFATQKRACHLQAAHRGLRRGTQGGSGGALGGNAGVSGHGIVTGDEKALTAAPASARRSPSASPGA